MTKMLHAQTGTTLVYYSDEFGIAIWWNHSATFNVWADGSEVDVFTRYDADTIDLAMAAADEWMTDYPLS